jgi:hypothetical protein
MFIQMLDAQDTESRKASECLSLRGIQTPLN